MRVLIVGAGRLGQALAHDLLRAGHDVALLDADAARLARVPRDLAGCATHGSALVRETLERASAACDAVTVVTRDDAFNAVVALAARRELAVPSVVAVIGSPARAEALAGLGAHVVCPTARAVGEIAHALMRSDVDSELHLGADAGIYRVEPPARVTGRSLAELTLEGALLPVALERDGRVQLALPSAIVEPGDVLHVAASDRAVIEEAMRP